MSEIKVYGADWCPMTQRTLAHLRHLGLEHKYVNIDQDPHARKWVEEQNDGKAKTPTVDIGGRILSEPSNHELDEVLAGAGRL